MVGARLPHGRLGGEGRGTLERVEGVLGGERTVQDRQPGPVVQHMPDQHPLLAVRLELRPVLAHRRVQVQLPAPVQQQRYGGGDALGRRADHLRGAPAPRFGAGRVVDVPGAAPQVDDLAPVPVDGDGRAPLAERGEVPYERVPHRLEALGHRAVHVHVRVHVPIHFPASLSLARDSGCNRHRPSAIPHPLAGTDRGSKPKGSSRRWARIRPSSESSAEVGPSAAITPSLRIRARGHSSRA
ncbi:hypothetical protein STENM327S_04618 [Streptomyces tendae]